MYAELISKSFHEREPILKDELAKLLPVSNKNTLNQTISYMVSFGLLKRLENGIYYIPSEIDKFSQLKPSLKDVINKKYLANFRGIRSGAYLLYKYKLTSQVSEFHEILSMNVSTHSRSKKEYGGKVSISYPKFEINEDNILYHEFLELLKNYNLSDYSNEESIRLLKKIFKLMDLKKDRLLAYSKYYKGNRLAYVRKLVKEVLNYEVA